MWSLGPWISPSEFYGNHARGILFTRFRPQTFVPSHFFSSLIEGYLLHHNTYPIQFYYNKLIVGQLFRTSLSPCAHLPWTPISTLCLCFSFYLHGLHKNGDIEWHTTSDSVIFSGLVYSLAWDGCPFLCNVDRGLSPDHDEKTRLFSYLLADT